MTRPRKSATRMVRVDSDSWLKLTDIAHELDLIYGRRATMGEALAAALWLGEECRRRTLAQNDRVENAVLVDR